MANEEMVYIGIESCGCVVAAMVDSFNNKKRTAKEIAAWITDGLTIERVTAGDARARVKPCTHQESAPKQEILFPAEVK